MLACDVVDGLSSVALFISFTFSFLYGCATSFHSVFFFLSLLLLSFFFYIHLLAFPSVSVCRHGGGKPSVSCPGAARFAEGDRSVECFRALPADPWFRADTPQLLLSLLLLCAPLH